VVYREKKINEVDSFSVTTDRIHMSSYELQCLESNKFNIGHTNGNKNDGLARKDSRCDQRWWK